MIGKVKTFAINHGSVILPRWSMKSTLRNTRVAVKN